MPCPRRGYNLRTLQGSRCPECGIGVRLGVHPTEPVLLLWSATLVEASLGAGIGVMFIALILGNAGTPSEKWYWVIAIAWVCIPIAAAIGFQRRRITQWPQYAQRVLVAAIGLVLLVLIVGIGRVVR